MICSSDVKTAVIARTIIFVKKKKEEKPTNADMRKEGYRFYYPFSWKLLQRWFFDKDPALFKRNVLPLVSHRFYHRNWAGLQR